MLIGLYSPVPRSGKTTVATFLLRHLGFSRVPFAQILKDMTRPILQSVGYSSQEILALEAGDKTEIIEPLGVSLRRIYQTLGTEWGRDCINPNMWTLLWHARVSDMLAADVDVVADDVRFPNEYDLIRSMGGQVWKITRPNTDMTCGHSSENGLEDKYFDRVVENNNTLWDLVTRLQDIPLG